MPECKKILLYKLRFGNIPEPDAYMGWLPAPFHAVK